MTLIKRSPFTHQEQEKVLNFFERIGVKSVYFPVSLHEGKLDNEFYAYAQAFNAGNVKGFIREYFADISPVSDNSPFFYKYYRFSDLFSSRLVVGHPVSGPVVFYSQLFMLLQSLGVMLVLVIVPLFVYRRDGLAFSRSPVAIFSVFGYFTCLGLGFMLIEVTLIQKLSLLWESPKYSLPIVICTLLIGAGAGSFVTGTLWAGRAPARLLPTLSAFVCLYLLLLTGLFGQTVEFLLAAPFLVRVLAMSAVLLPLGFALGFFFPLGLRRLSLVHPDAVAWGWAINICFSVMGTVLAVMVAQFVGFDAVLYLAAALYICAAVLGRVLDFRLPVVN